MHLIPQRKDLAWTPYAWLLYLGFFFLQPALRETTSILEWTATIAGALVFLALYFRGHWTTGREMVAVGSAIALLGAAFLPYNSGAGALFIYAAAFACRIGTTAQGVTFIVAVELLLLSVMAIAHLNFLSVIWAVMFTAIVGAINLHYEQLGRSNRKLEMAHDEIEHLAKVAERERIARDLHDLLGHTLSLIILKSELASKLSARDPERASAEIRDVERISRDALAQVRSAVRGYRSGGVRGELDQTRAALETAGVEVVVDTLDVRLPAGVESVLALAIRESATNIVRHANAKHCAIRIRIVDDVCVATIGDDGRGGNASFGTGLSGMRERIEALGGTLVHDGSKGTTLTIRLPLGSTPVDIAARQESA
jgi:two-component system sensor histidine kinase DesK